MRQRPDFTKALTEFAGIVRETPSLSTLSQSELRLKQLNYLTNNAYRFVPDFDSEFPKHTRHNEKASTIKLAVDYYRQNKTTIDRQQPDEAYTGWSHELNRRQILGHHHGASDAVEMAVAANIATGYRVTEKHLDRIQKLNLPNADAI